MSNTLKNTYSYDETTPILIVGGSLVGLSMALFLFLQTPSNSRLQDTQKRQKDGQIMNCRLY
jgi:2-polyprenyl-6-methoxyphenol hydroxylase-like FAD-dependent oxidoreductase